MIQNYSILLIYLWNLIKYFQVYLLVFIYYQDHSKIKALARRKSNQISENNYFLYCIAILLTCSCISKMNASKIEQEFYNLINAWYLSVFIVLHKLILFWLFFI